MVGGNRTCVNGARGDFGEGPSRRIFATIFWVAPTYDVLSGVDRTRVIAPSATRNVGAGRRIQLAVGSVTEAREGSGRCKATCVLDTRGDVNQCGAIGNFVLHLRVGAVWLVEAPAVDGFSVFGQATRTVFKCAEGTHCDVGIVGFAVRAVTPAGHMVGDAKRTDVLPARGDVDKSASTCGDGLKVGDGTPTGQDVARTSLDATGAFASGREKVISAAGLKSRGPVERADPDA